MDVNWFPLQKFGPPFPRGDATGSFKAGQMGWAFSWFPPPAKSGGTFNRRDLFLKKTPEQFFLHSKTGSKNLCSLGDF